MSLCLDFGIGEALDSVVVSCLLFCSADMFSVLCWKWMAGFWEWLWWLGVGFTGLFWFPRQSLMVRGTNITVILQYLLTINGIKRLITDIQGQPVTPSTCTTNSPVLGIQKSQGQI